MVLELITGGELFDFVALKRFSPQVSRYYFKQMLQVLHYMHAQGVTHRDLKPENIMLDANYNIRFADFGFAAPTEGRDGTGFLKTILGTGAYMAPELHTRQKYKGQEVDLFAMAIILFILYTGHPPFNSAHPTKDPYYVMLAEGRIDAFWAQHSKNKPQGFFEPAFVDLMTHMLALQPTARLSLADTVAHPWMQGATATQAEVVAEFRQRHETIKEQQRAEAAAAMQQKPTSGQRVRRDFKLGDRVYVDVTYQEGAAS